MSNVEPMKITNRRAFYDYEIQDRFEAGINLYGYEVKAVKTGHADLSGSFVRIMGSEAYIVNAKIFPYQPGQIEGYDERRTRKLLLHKKEIISLKSKAEGAGLTLVPLSFYLKRGLIKVEVGIGKGKKQYDKKEAKKRADLKRDIEQELEA
ncbi:MAG: SsrA-binding protein [Candidatus Levybacteria bacterium GW2011_GWC2_40_7]|nr:MAG: SsrA-binding protein [Candidatus Levybacteria bacterium GW2011_GWC2_40_7]KKR95167.1 MAG: SsrA-binding protein [Candidatus Levybacteria bacterium GW2011_GWA2_41_15]